MQSVALAEKYRTIARLEAELKPDGTWSLRGLMSNGREFLPPNSFKMSGRRTPEEVIALVTSIETFFNTRFLLVRGKASNAVCFYPIGDGSLSMVDAQSIFERHSWETALSSTPLAA